MIRILTALFALVLTIGAFSNAHAQNFPAFNKEGRPFYIDQMTGSHFAFFGTSTNAALDFGFTADFVEICMYPQSAAVFVRFGRGMTELEGSDRTTGWATPAEWATTVSIFQQGNLRLSGRAFAMSNSADINASVASLDYFCRGYPFRTPGLVFAVSAAGTATLDVNAFRAGR